MRSRDFTCRSLYAVGANVHGQNQDDRTRLHFFSPVRETGADHVRRSGGADLSAADSRPSIHEIQSEAERRVAPSESVKPGVGINSSNPDCFSASGLSAVSVCAA